MPWSRAAQLRDRELQHIRLQENVPFCWLCCLWLQREWNTQTPRGTLKSPGQKPFCLTDQGKVNSCWITLIIYRFVDLGLFFKPAAYRICWCLPMILQSVAALLFKMRELVGHYCMHNFIFLYTGFVTRRKFLRATNQLSEDKLPLLSINVNATLSPAWWHKFTPELCDWGPSSEGYRRMVKASIVCL